MSTATIDYDALAKQAGAMPSASPGGQEPDYVALAKQAGAISSTPLAPQGEKVTIGPDPDAGTMKGWLRNLENDLRYGGDRTGLGSVLKAMGARGLNMGVSEGVADYMGSPLLGTVHAAQGVAETPEHPIKGPLHAVGGVLEAATIPSGFVVPEVGEAAPALVKAGAEVAGDAGQAIKNVISPATRAANAGVKFKEVMNAAKDVPVQLDNAQPGILRLMDWQKKTQLGPTINKFLNRVTNPNLPQITYAESRDFYTLLGKMSADEMSKLPPAIRYDVTQTVMGLKKDVGAAAEVVGKGEQYSQAMKEFASAKKWENLSDTTKQVIWDTARTALLGGAGAAAAKKVWDNIP